MNAPQCFGQLLRCQLPRAMGILLRSRLVWVLEPFAVFPRRFKFMRFCSGRSNLGILSQCICSLTVKMHECLGGQGRFPMYTLALVQSMESITFKCIWCLFVNWSWFNGMQSKLLMLFKPPVHMCFMYQSFWRKITTCICALLKKDAADCEQIMKFTIGQLNQKLCYARSFCNSSSCNRIYRSLPSQQGPCIII